MRFGIFIYDGVEPIDLATFGVLSMARRVARAFEAKCPDIAVRVERSGAERIFQRIAQEAGILRCAFCQVR